MDYWDYGLSHDHTNNFSLLSTTGIITTDLVLFFDFNNSDTTDNLTSFTGATKYGSNYIESEYSWTGSTTSGFTLDNISLNDYNPPYTGGTLTIVSGDNETKLYYINVTGQSVNFLAQYSSDFSGDYVDLGGGFFQGFYRLHDYPYQLLPNRFFDGWTADFTLKLGDNSHLFSGTTGNTLNDIHSGNTGIFYYWGVRSENKFWNEFSGETGLTTTSTIPLSPQYTIYEDILDPDYIFDWCDDEEEIISYSGCSESGITDNIFALRITPDGRLGYRLVTIKDPCDPTFDLTGDCTNNVVIEEQYTVDPIFSGSNCTPYYEDGVRIFGTSNWINVTAKWEREYPYDTECDLVYGDYKLGTLKLYVNARPVLTVTGFTEFIPYELSTHKDKQLGVPYNMSWGGGSLGLGLSQTFSGDSGNNEVDYLDYDRIIETYFAGTFHGGISQFKFYTKPLDFTEIRYNYDQIKSRYRLKGDFGGDNFVLPKNGCVDDAPCEGGCSGPDNINCPINLFASNMIYTVLDVYYCPIYSIPCPETLYADNLTYTILDIYDCLILNYL